jgi:hypothetical protein
MSEDPALQTENRLLQLAFADMQMNDDKIQNCLEDISRRKKKIDTRAIIFKIGDNCDSYYEKTINLLLTTEYIFYRFRLLLDKREISPYDYVMITNHLINAGFQPVANFNYIRNLHSRSPNEEFIKLERYRLELLEILKDRPEIVEAFNFNQPLWDPTEGAIFTSKGNVMNHHDEISKFANLSENGMSYIAHIMKIAMDEFKAYPHHNAGYAVLNFIERNKNEKLSEFEDRCNKSARDIGIFISKELNGHKLLPRVSIMVSKMGEIDVSGIIPTKKLNVLDKDKNVQALMSSLEARD